MLQTACRFICEIQVHSNLVNLVLMNNELVLTTLNNLFCSFSQSTKVDHSSYCLTLKGMRYAHLYSLWHTEHTKQIKHVTYVVRLCYGNFIVTSTVHVYIRFGANWWKICPAIKAVE